MRGRCRQGGTISDPGRNIIGIKAGANMGSPKRPPKGAMTTSHEVLVELSRLDLVRMIAPGAQRIGVSPHYAVKAQHYNE